MSGSNTPKLRFARRQIFEKIFLDFFSTKKRSKILDHFWSKKIFRIIFSKICLLANLNLGVFDPLMKKKFQKIISWPTYKHHYGI